MIIKLASGEFELKVLDPTHVTMQLIGGNSIAWAYHVMQLGPEITDKLKAAGIMDENLYVR